MGFLSNLKKSFLTDEFNKNILKVFSGTLIAQLIPILISPILSRLYEPYIFGLAALFLSIIIPLRIIVSGRYEMAIALPQEELKAYKVTSLSLVAAFLSCLFLFILIACFNNSLLILINAPIEFKLWSYFIPIGILLLSCNQTLNYLLMRKKKFGMTSINKISETTTNSTFTIFIGFLTSTFSGALIVGELLGSLMSMLIGFYQAVKVGYRKISYSYTELKSLAQEYVEFPKYGAIPAFLNAFTLHIPVFFISAFYSLDSLGFYNQSRIILSAPLMLISISVGQVFYQKVIELKNTKQLIAPFFRKVALGLLMIFFPFFLLMLFVAPSIFAFIFGDKWEVAGDYTSILIWGYYIKFIVSPLSMTLLALKEVKLNSIWQILSFLSISGLYFFRSYNITTFLYISTLTEIVLYLLYGCIIYFAIKKNDQKIS